MELLKEIPLLPIFGDFNSNEKRDDVFYLEFLIKNKYKLLKKIYELIFLKIIIIDKII